MKITVLTRLALAGALLGVGFAAQAQHSIPHSSSPPRPTGSFGTGSRPMGGMIVGNKNTKVYHLPGDKGGLPSAKNAVYFQSEAQARAAGYRPAGMRRTPNPQRPGHTGSPMRRPQGSFGTPTGAQR